MSSTDTKVFAHTLRDFSAAHWELLETHLADVERLASEHAAGFQATSWGAHLGRCHDLGKASKEFQEYLHISAAGERVDASVEHGKPGRVDHSTYGARYVTKNADKVQGQILAYCIAGHHGGLPNAVSGDDVSQRSTLSARLDERHTIPAVPPPYPPIGRLTVPWDAPSRLDLAFALAFFTRMLFSCLVDADRTCTEAFCDTEKAAERAQSRPTLAELRARYESYLAEFMANAEQTPVNLLRREVLGECRAAAALDPGFFSLQVPTGGGKTLSSLAFALDHAQQHSLRRIVVAIPFTSIIDQTADVYRKALGPLAQGGLLEHHTNLQPERDTRDNQLASENWDAPLIVTTNVQLFESLFAARTTPCRKLHRLAGSVIILDEAQTLPVQLLAPTLRALRELVARYGCTIVLCTATQPALERRQGFEIGLENVRSIIADSTSLFAALRRAEIRFLGKLTNDELVSRMASEESVLTIVNTRAHAAELFSAVRERCGPDSCFHLSTLMCAAHRRRVLAQIRQQVKAGPCRVVSTQLIEAGVDVDFPVVYRAEAGFDSLAQAAGRCNREGSLPEPGITYVFEAEKKPPPGFLADTAQVARELFDAYPDPLSPSAIEAYFRHYYWKSTDLLDKECILEMTSIERHRELIFQFRDIEKAYKVIPDREQPVLIPFDKVAQKLLDSLLSGNVPFVAHRQLQPFLVAIPERNLHLFESSGTVQQHDSGVWLLLRKDAYDEAQGLKLEALGLDPRAWSV